MVKIPVEIATFQNHQFCSLVRVLDHLVTTTVTTPISTEVILAVIKLLITTTRVTAILVTAILATAMLCQVKNIVFITRMLKCQCSTSQDSFLLVISWAVIAKVILVSKNYSVYLNIILWNIFSVYTLSERSLIVVTKFTQHFLMAVYVFYKPKIYLQQYKIVCHCDWWLPWLHKAVGQNRREDAFLMHFRVLRGGYRFLSIYAYLRLPQLIG